MDSLNIDGSGRITGSKVKFTIGISYEASGEETTLDWKSSFDFGLIVNYRKNPVYRIFEAVRSEAAGYGISIVKSEFIGMVPRDAIVDTINHYLMSDIENKDILDFKAGKI